PGPRRLHHLIAFPLDVPSRSPRYPLSLHDALPISPIVSKTLAGPITIKLARAPDVRHRGRVEGASTIDAPDQQTSEHRIDGTQRDRKSTRLNSSHVSISYAVFCLKKKTKAIYEPEV